MAQPESKEDKSGEESWNHVEFINYLKNKSPVISMELPHDKINQMFGYYQSKNIKSMRQKYITAKTKKTQKKQTPSKNIITRAQRTIENFPITNHSNTQETEFVVIESENTIPNILDEISSDYDNNEITTTTEQKILPTSVISSENERVIYVDFDAYKEDLHKCYATDAQYKDQFLRDVNRCDLYLNGIKVKYGDTVIEFLDCEFKNSKKRLHEVLMLCTQGVMGYFYELLSNELIKQNFYLGEINMLDEYEDRIYSIEIMYNRKKDEYTINVYKTMRIFYIHQTKNDITKYYVYMKMSFVENQSVVEIKFKIKPANQLLNMLKRSINNFEKRVLNNKQPK
jgi:hypothetical protein